MKAFNRNSHWKVFSNLIYNSKFCQKISPFYITSESRQPLSFQQKENIVKVDLKHNFLWITFKRVQTSLMFFQIHLHYHIELYFYPLFYSHHHCSNYVLHPLPLHHHQHFTSYFLLLYTTSDDFFCFNYWLVQVSTYFH